MHDHRRIVVLWCNKKTMLISLILIQIDSRQLKKG